MVHFLLLIYNHLFIGKKILWYDTNHSKREWYIMSKNEETVHVDNIEIGYVGLFENQCTRIKVLRKIMFAKILDEDHIGLNCSNQAISYGIITPTGPKKIGVDDLKKGVDLCEKINGKKIIYPVTEANSVDGDIIIFDTIEVGVFLRYIGFPL